MDMSTGTSRREREREKEREVILYSAEAATITSNDI